MKYIIWTLLSTLTFCDSQSQELIPFRVDTLWGYEDKQGVVKLEPQFQYANKFMGDIAIVAKNEKLGAINKDDKLLIPFEYEFLRSLDSSEFLFGYRAEYFGEYFMGVITKNGIIKIPSEYSFIFKKENTYLVSKNTASIIGQTDIGDIRTVTSTYGLFDIDGKVLIPCRYNYISWKNDSLIVVDSAYLMDDQSKQAMRALFNNKGEQLTGFEYTVFGNFIEGLAIAGIDNKYGFIYPTGKVAIPIEFEYCENFSNGYALIQQGDTWGAINKKGKIVIEPTKEYQEVKNELKEKYFPLVRVSTNQMKYFPLVRVSTNQILEIFHNLQYIPGISFWSLWIRRH